MMSFPELLDAIGEVQRDLEYLMAHADFDHVPHLYTISNAAARMESLCMQAHARARIGEWPPEERAHFLSMAVYALDTMAKADQQRAKLLTDEAIRQARASTLH